MAEQLNLFSDNELWELEFPDYRPGASLEERFWIFHNANPHVMTNIANRALALKRRGIQHFGIAAIFESMRYDAAIKTGGDTYKLNNSYRAFYARQVMKSWPELEGFFELREQTSKRG